MANATRKKAGRGWTTFCEALGEGTTVFNFKERIATTTAALTEAEHRAERYREAQEELWNAVHGYLNERDIDRYDLVTTDRGDNLNAALVHADRELATTAGPGGTG